jgi:hypothetical protein
MRVLLSVLVAVPVASSPAWAALIGFEEQAVGTNVTSQYAAQGVVFASVPNPGSNNTATILDFPFFGVRSLGPGGPAPNFGGTLIMSFAPLVTSVGNWVLDDQSPITVTAFNAANVPVGMVVLDGLGSPAEFWSLSHAAGIARVEMVPANQLDGWAVDDLTFTPIPAPGSIGLMLMAAGVAVRRRRA